MPSLVYSTSVACNTTKKEGPFIHIPFKKFIEYTEWTLFSKKI